MNVGRLATVLLMGAALQVAADARADETRSGRCYGVRVRAAGSPGERNGRRHTPVLSAAEAKDLAFVVSISADAASRPVQVRLFSPRGRLYQVLDALVDENTTEGVEGRRRSRRHVRSLVARLPVSGTQITTYAMFGTWRAEVYLDGADTPCTRPMEFVIEP